MGRLATYDGGPLEMRTGMLSPGTNGQRGFTLIELLVVVLIIGLLVLIVIPVTASSERRAAQRACYSSIRTMEGAIAQYYAERAAHGGPVIDTGNIAAALVSSIATSGGTYGPWLADMPTCPARGTYSVQADGHTITCSVHGHF